MPTTMQTIYPGCIDISRSYVYNIWSVFLYFKIYGDEQPGAEGLWKYIYFFHITCTVLEQPTSWLSRTHLHIRLQLLNTVNIYTVQHVQCLITVPTLEREMSTLHPTHMQKESLRTINGQYWPLPQPWFSIEINIYTNCSQ